MERGEIPEVAALGNALTTLFSTLGMSQSAYAVRVSLDKSVVSRSLRGRRVATQDFIDRLVREVEARHSSPVQPEVHSNLRRLRLSALQVCDPAVYELESLRAEMEQAHRKAEILARHQEALHDLLEKKETHIRRLHVELDQVRQDWIADRPTAESADVQVRASRSSDEDGVAEEIARLKAELADVAAARADAERRCAELESQVREMEEELGARSGESGSVLLPLEIVQDQVMAHWEAGRTKDAARELTEAALTRSVDDLSDLVTWLDSQGDHLHGDHVVREVARVRDVDDVAAFGKLTLDRQWTPSFLHQAAARAGLLAAEACLVMTPRNIAVLHALWPDRWDPGAPRVLRPTGAPHSVLAALLESPRTLDDVAQVMAVIPADDRAAVKNLHSSTTGFRQAYTLSLLPIALEHEWHEFLSLLIADFVRTADADSVWLALNDTRLSRMTAAQWRAMTRALLECLSLEQFSPVFHGICRAHKDLLTPQGLERTPLFVILRELHDRGLLPDFAKVVGSRAAFRPKSRKERSLARAALIAWHKRQD